MNPNASTTIELASRLGVPTFVLIVAMFLLAPRLDRQILLAERVDAELALLVASCVQPRPVLIPMPPDTP